MDTDQRTPLVPDGFQPPAGLVTASFLLEPLGPQHNQSDYDAWTSSMEHIRATPGFLDGTWPHAMTARAEPRRPGAARARLPNP